MASTSVVTTTLDGSEDVEQQQEEQLVLRLRPPASPPHVTWAADVVDNEHLGRLKSNCCCIYVAPRRWDDPSTWEPDEHETEHCRGHTEKKREEPEKKEDGEKDEAPEKKEHDGCGCDHC